MHSDTSMQLIDCDKRYSEIFLQTPFGYFLVDKQGIIQDINTTAENMIGIQKERLLQQSFSRYLLPEYQYSFKEHLRHAFLKERMPLTRIRLLKRNGPAIDVILKGVQLRKNKNVQYILLTVLELAEFIEPDEKRSQDNRSLEFINSVTHEMNQSLAVISNYIHGCIRRLSSKSYHLPDILNALTISSCQLTRAGEVILNFKNILIDDCIEKQEICLDKIITQVIDIIKMESHEIKDGIEYKKFSRISKIQGNETQIQNVILNLVRNSVESIRDHGTKDGKIIIELNSLEKDTVEICVRDNGPGFSDQILHRIFDPCFTTKPYGIGTGLTLCKKIAEVHGGRLSVDPDPAFGASLKFILPLA